MHSSLVRVREVFREALSYRPRGPGEASALRLAVVSILVGGSLGHVLWVSEQPPVQVAVPWLLAANLLVVGGIALIPSRPLRLLAAGVLLVNSVLARPLLAGLPLGGILVALLTPHTPLELGALVIAALRGRRRLGTIALLLTLAAVIECLVTPLVLEHTM